MKGIENVPIKGPGIIVANHSGMLPYDAVMLNMAIYNNHLKKRNLRFLVADFVDNFPLLSLFIQRTGGVKASPLNAERLLSKSELVCIFPEGVNGVGKLYKDRYKIQEFGHGGVIRLAKKTGVPIIPCAVIGAEEIHPIIYKFDEFGKKLGLPYFPVTPTFPLFGLVGLIPLPSRWVIRFGQPIHLKRSRRSEKEQNSALKSEIQRMIDEELIRRF